MTIILANLNNIRFLMNLLSCSL